MAAAAAGRRGHRRRPSLRRVLRRRSLVRRRFPTYRVVVRTAVTRSLQGLGTTGPSPWNPNRDRSPHLPHFTSSTAAVPGAGLEPACPFGQWCLRPSRLPIPPSGRAKGSLASAFSTAATRKCYVRGPGGQKRASGRHRSLPAARRSSLLPAFVFPGQGAQRPGMGRRGWIIPPGTWWTTHLTRPAVTSAYLLLDAVDRGADRDPQRPAGHVHLQPGRARRRRAPRHRADRRAPATPSASTAPWPPAGPSGSRTACASWRSGARPCRRRPTPSPG